MIRTYHLEPITVHQLAVFTFVQPHKAWRIAHR